MTLSEKMPVAERVCKALGSHLGGKVEFAENCFWFGGREIVSYIYKEVTINNVSLTPYLIAIIGLFYESLESKAR